MWQQREGGEEKKEREGQKRGPDEGTAMAAEWNPISDTVKGCLPSQEQSHKTERGIGEGERMSGRPYVVSGPLPWVLLGVWFHISLGNDYLMEKLGALKMKKENENINGSRVVPVKTKTQLVWVATVYNATYSWVNNYHVITWRGRLHTLSHVHIKACYTV